MKNRGSTPILTNLVGVQLRNIHNLGQISESSREGVNNGILHSDIQYCQFVCSHEYFPFACESFANSYANSANSRCEFADFAYEYFPIWNS